MTQNVFDAATGTTHQFPDDATPAEIQEAMDSFAPPPPSGLTLKRVGQDALAVGTGALKGVQNLAGMWGDVQQLGPQDPSAAQFPTSQDVGNVVSKISQSLGGPDSLPSATSTPEGPFFQAAGQGAVGMMSPDPWLTAYGALAGIAGEGASRLANTNGANDTFDGGKSMWRSAAQLATLIPVIASGFRAPAEIRAFKPTVDTISTDPAAVNQAVDLASAKAGVAANRLSMPFTSTWSQLPQLGKAVAELRATPQGAPLNAQVADEGAAIARELPGQKLGRVWDPTFGWIDETTPLVNMLSQAKATAPDLAVPGAPPAQPSLVAKANNNIVGSAISLLNPSKLVESFGQYLKTRSQQSTLSEIAQSLASGNAPNFIKTVANYSPLGNAVKNIVQSLMTLQMDSGPPAQNTANQPPALVRGPDGLFHPGSQ